MGWATQHATRARPPPNRAAKSNAHSQGVARCAGDSAAEACAADRPSRRPSDAEKRAPAGRVRAEPHPTQFRLQPVAAHVPLFWLPAVAIALDRQLGCRGARVPLDAVLFRRSLGGCRADSNMALLLPTHSFPMPSTHRKSWASSRRGGWSPSWAQRSGAHSTTAVLSAPLPTVARKDDGRMQTAQTLSHLLQGGRRGGRHLLLRCLRGHRNHPSDQSQTSFMKGRELVGKRG